MSVPLAWVVSCHLAPNGREVVLAWVLYTPTGTKGCGRGSSGGASLFAPQFPRRRSRAPPVPASQAALRTKLGKQPPGAGMCQADAAVGAPAAPWGRDMPELPMWWHLEETLEHQIGGAE